jgi:hypothetical protein
MGPARPPLADTAGGAWLVVDLVDTQAPAELVAAVIELAGDGRGQVEGAAVIVPPGAATGLEQVTAVETDRGGPAQRLARAEASLPPQVEVIVHGDRRLLSDAELVAATRGLALLDEAQAAVVHGAPVTDSLRRVDDGGRLVGCVDRTDLVTLGPPHVLRREIVAEVAALAADSADGSVAAGLTRGLWPVRVLDLGVAVSDRVANAPAADSSRAG